MMWALFGLFAVVAAASAKSSPVAVEQISSPTLATKRTHGALRGTATSALVIKPADGVAAGMLNAGDWRHRLLELTNSERARYGAPPLVLFV